MPDRETPVEHRAVPPARPKSENHRSALTTTSGDTVRARHQVLAIGGPADLARAVVHPAVASGRFAVVESIALDLEAPDEGTSTLAEAARLLRGGHIDTLLVAGEIGRPAMRRVADLALAFHCTVLALMPTEVLDEHQPVVVWTGDGPLIQLGKLPRHPVDLSLKRAMDVIGAAIGLVASAPLLLVLAALITLESRGAPVFEHERIGRRGRRFKCLKLRTMCPNAEEILRADPDMYREYLENHFKIPEHRDPRVTRLGRLLRRTSLDELPQLWNVLVGDMSLVGPRPMVAEELAHYGDDRDLVLSVKPGLTGAWAVSGRQAVGYPKRCDLETRYVRGRTLAGDLRIIVKTIGVVFTRANG